MDPKDKTKIQNRYIDYDEALNSYQDPTKDPHEKMRYIGVSKDNSMLKD